MNKYTNLTLENIDNEHLCCAIADKKHQEGVKNKKEWLKDRIKEGHIFRKLDAQGKVFIEYSDLESAWIPIEGDNYLYIYCLWVSGQYKGKGYAKELLDYAINDAKERKKSGICIISSKKKKPFISDKKFFEHFGFMSCDTIDEYELLALSFDKSYPRFKSNVKEMEIPSKECTIYYSPQCPYTVNCIEEITKSSQKNNIDVDIICIDSLDKAKNMPCIFNNWAVFINGKFVSTTLLNENSFLKLLGK